MPALSTSEHGLRLNTVPLMPGPATPPDPLVVAIGRVCRDMREAAGIKQVRVAAHVDVDQSTLARFERGGGWPRHPKSVGLYLRAYAEELGVDPAELLHTAVDLWRDEGGSSATVPEHGPLLPPGGHIETRARDAERRKPVRRRRGNSGAGPQSG